MFIVPCKYVEGCLIEQSIKAIRELHPLETILVVDSDSSDKSYFELLKPYNVIIADIANKHYESGAFWYAVQNYKEHWYVVIQDSVILKQHLHKYLHDFEQFYCFINFNENTLTHHMSDQTGSYGFVSRINEMIGGFDKISHHDNLNFTGVFGPSFIIKRTMVNLMLKNKLNETLLPENKFDHQITERIYGLVAKQCGVDLNKNTILGNLHQLKSTNMQGEVLVTDLLNKVWFANKRQ